MDDADFSLSIAPISARFSLRGNAEMARCASPALGMDLPQTPLSTAETGSAAALWLGPDEWLLLGCSADLTAELSKALGSHPHSLVDISERQVGMDISGRLAALILSSGCPLDLEGDSFAIGMAMRTLFHKAEIVLWRRGAQRFHLEVWRSFAPYVEGHLAEARRGCWGL